MNAILAPPVTYENSVSVDRNFIGPYRLIRLIRSGNTTQVWEALKEGEKERVALKVLLQQHRKNKVEIEHLRHEANVGKELDHPSVIKIFEFYNQHGLPFLAMQLFNAKNLKIAMREIPEFVELNLKTIIRRCAEGLQHLHEKGWVHCDVKPDNFLADEQANVKLIDFSIAEKAKKGFSLFARKPKTIRGTRSYMSPEQIRRKVVDARADMYGLGCVMFELLAGRTPFTAPTPDVLLSKHLRAPVPSLEACSYASSSFTKLVSRMLAKDPKDRPETMGDFLQEFRTTPIYRPGKGPSRMVRRKATD